jgi:poly [ADP-ribose] polymerase
MSELKSRRVPDNSVGDFTETIAYHVMHQANVEKNSNKFFCLELQKSKRGHYRVFTHYGRLGITDVYEVRDNIGGSPITDEGTARDAFDSLHEKKLHGKRDKESGELLHYVDVDVVSPSVGSENIRGKAEKTVTVKAAIDTTSSDPRVSRLLDQLVKENIHNITQNTSIKFTAGGYATELGPVTPQHVARAREALQAVNKLIGKDGADADDQRVQKANSAYFSLIPKPFSMKISSEDMILTSDAVVREFDILDQLETGVKMGAAMTGSTGQRLTALGTDIEWLEDLDEVKRIKAYVRGSKAGNHRSTDVWDYDVVSIYRVKLPAERARYEGTVKRYGNVQEVFHGSANANLLSILKGGLIIPPSTAGHVTGRLNGAALYGAIQSTKSLNYSTGFWGGKRSSFQNAFLFLADFAMGRTFETTSSTPNGAPRGYDSVWAKPGYLHNHELMVYSLEQCTLKYLVEMRK